MAKKKQQAFLLPKEMKSIVDELDNEEAGIILKAIYDYEETKEEPKLEKTLKIVFKQFKMKLDAYDEAYKEKCLKNKENIEKYWSQKKDEDNTTEYDGIRMYTNKNKNKNKKENKNISECEIISNNSDNNLSSSDCVAHTPTLDDISLFATEIGLGGNLEYCENFFDHYEGVGWINGAGQKIQNWKSVFRNWCKKDGLLKPKEKKLFMYEDENGQIVEEYR